MLSRSKVSLLSYAINGPNLYDCLSFSCHNVFLSIHSHFSGSTLDASVGHQGPVVPLAGAERTLPGFLVNLHLKRLHVRLIFLVGCEAYSWEGQSEHVFSLIQHENSRTI